MQKNESENLYLAEYPGHRPFLTTKEENNIVTYVEMFADQGYFVRKCDVENAVGLMVSTFPEGRENSVRG